MAKRWGKKKGAIIVADVCHITDMKISAKTPRRAFVRTRTGAVVLGRSGVWHEGIRCHCVTADPWCAVRAPRPSGALLYSWQYKSPYGICRTHWHTSARVCVCVRVFVLHACMLCGHICVSILLGTFHFAYWTILLQWPIPFKCFFPPFQSSDLQHTAFLCLILTCQPPAIVCPWLAPFSLSSSCVYWSHL